MAQAYGDGRLCDAPLLAALSHLMERRRRPGDPAAPTTSGLRVRREGLPDWWNHGGNLLLAAAGGRTQLRPGFGVVPVNGCVAVLGAGSQMATLSFMGADSLVVIGDRALQASSSIGLVHGGCVMIGEATTASGHTRIDSRNGGAVIVGADGMWRGGVTMMTDDMHAIVDAGTGLRVNGFGGRITVDRHVLLEENVKLLAGARVGADTVVQPKSMVKNSVLPANSVCAGRPAKPVRTGTTWTREDLP